MDYIERMLGSRRLFSCTGAQRGNTPVDPSMIQISVNGQPKQLPPGISVGGLIEALALTGKRVAVECNGEIVPRSRHAEATLHDGDRLEIVVAVGGG
jgi:sulfur carrier protein